MAAANIALIYAATPVAIAAAGALLLHERMSLPQLAGVALALGGVLFVIAKGDLRKLLGVRFAISDAWVVVAGLSWTAYSLLLRLWPSRLGSAERPVPQRAPCRPTSASQGRRLSTVWAGLSYPRQLKRRVPKRRPAMT